MKISVIAPVKNEFPWIGYSIMSALPYVHEFIYALSKSTDGTEELLRYLQDRHKNIKVIPFRDFSPEDQASYNESFNACIEEAQGDACWFLHPDMIVTKGSVLKEGPLAWWTTITSFAGDFGTAIVKGRAQQWKNIHAKSFGLHYYGGYGSTNEDFYHSDITGKSYRHYGVAFSEYPYEVADSGFKINHYCELKNYRRRLEKMKACLRTQFPQCDDLRIEEMAIQHPRVTLEPTTELYGVFEFAKVKAEIPDIIKTYENEFQAVKTKGELVYG